MTRSRALLTVSAPDCDGKSLAAEMLSTGDWRPFTLPTVSFANGNHLRLPPETPVPEAVDVLWPVGREVGDGLIRLGMALDCLQRARPTIRFRLLVPYFPYSRSNAVERGGSSLGAAVLFRFLDALPITEFVVFSPHTPQLVGFSRRIVTPVGILDDIADWMRGEGRTDIVLAPDRGRAEDALRLAELLDRPVEVLLKHRVDHEDRARPVLLSRPALAGCHALVYDDELTTGSTLLAALSHAERAGARGVTAVVARSFADDEVIAGLLAHPLLTRLATTALTPDRHLSRFVERRLPIVPVPRALEQCRNARA